MKNLIGMVDFVLEINKTEESCREDFVKCVRYANFLKQPLELWMFVPCDENGDVLEEVPYYADGIEKVNEYKKAKERCLFDGFSFNMREDNFTYIDVSVKEGDFQLIFDEEADLFLIDTSELNEYINTIEDLVKYNLELTPTAQL